MVSLYGILNLGSRGVSAAQTGLNTTGHNVSNVNTEGYSRQRVVQRSLDPIITPQGAWDTGVEVKIIERLRDDFLEKQIRSSVSDATYYEQLETYFTQLEAIFNDPLNPVSDTQDTTSSGGLNNLLSRFFRSMNEVSLNPESTEVRTSAIESATTLSDTLNLIESEMYNFLNSMNSRVEMLIEEVDALAQQMVTLNQRVALAEANQNVQANDYRDERDRVLKRLAEIVPISTQENEAGIINVSVAGQWLVDNLTVNPFVPEVTRRYEQIDILGVRLGEEGLYLLDHSLSNGEMGAAFDLRDQILPDILQDLTDMTRSLIYETNKIHSSSSGLEGYSEVQSSFFYLEGQDDSDSSATLDRVFNNPIHQIDSIFGKNPFSIQEGQFQIRVADSENNTRDMYDVQVKPDDNLYEMVEKINRADGIVQEARSAYKFDPVFVERATATKGEEAAEAGFQLRNLNAAQGTPAAEAAAGTGFQFEIHIKNANGNLVDSNTGTPAYDPFVVNFQNDDTLSDLRNAIQTVGAPDVFRATLVESADDSTVQVLQVEPIEENWSISFQNDDSGLIEAFEFPMTDPTIPQIGGTATSVETSFANPPGPAASFLGAGDPQFSPVFTDPSPNVIDDGTFEFVVIDNAYTPTVNTITVGTGVGEVDTVNELAAALQAADPNITTTVTADNRLVVESSNNREFFFQNDDTGLIEAMGFSDYSGFGEINGVPFQEGTFEVVMTNDEGTVTNIFEVPVQADPSVVGGAPTLNDIVDTINAAASTAGASLQASIATDPTDDTKNLIKIEAGTGYEFTFRSDDSLLLSALGFTKGPVLDPTGNNPILGAEFPIAVGDNIGGMVRAEINNNVGFKISTTGTDEITFVGEDTSHFLAAAGVNGLFTGYNARTIQVNGNIVDNVSLLATSKDGTKGNNEAILSLAELEDEEVIDGQTLGGFYRAMVARMGTEASKSTQLKITNETVLRELEAIQEENAGVSIDEESINLIKYQQAYQASAKIIQAVDQMLDLIINRLGA
ncbi:flagellar hook-associated protein FlgK [bacterium]|nr:flagellar hook-associated protein FlgK [bacterium]